MKTKERTYTHCVHERVHVRYWNDTESIHRECLTHVFSLLEFVAMRLFFWIRMKKNSEAVLADISAERSRRQKEAEDAAALSSSSSSSSSSSFVSGTSVSTSPEWGQHHEQQTMRGVEFGTRDGYERRRRKRLGVVARNTLEAYYMRDKNPNATIVSELCSLLNHPPQQIREWFAERSAEERARESAMGGQDDDEDKEEDARRDGQGEMMKKKKVVQGALSSRPRRATKTLRTEMRKMRTARLGKNSGGRRGGRRGGGGGGGIVRCMSGYDENE